MVDFVSEPLKDGDTVRFFRPDLGDGTIAIQNTVGRVVGVPVPSSDGGSIMVIFDDYYPGSPISCHIPWLTKLTVPDTTDLASIEQFLQEDA